MHSLDPDNIRKILIRSTNWIGDAVMSTPAMCALRSSFPRAEIVLVANPPVSELMAGHPCCDRVIVYDKKGAHRGVRGLLRFSSELAHERFDLAVLFQYAIDAAIIAWLAGIGKRAGFDTDRRRLLLTHAVRAGSEALKIHHSIRYLYMLEKLGIPAPPSGLSLFCSEEETAWARGTLGGGKWAAINPGAAFGSAKRWYPERFASVADALREQYGLRVILLGGPGEAEIGADIEAGMHSAPLNMIGKTSVRQMMALLSRVELVITNDSGPMHVAAAFDRPIVALFGPTDHTTTSPACSRHRVVRREIECAPCLKRKCPGDHRCMADLTVDDVIEAVAHVMDDSK